MDRPALTSAGGAGVQMEGSFFPSATLSCTTGMSHTCVDTAASTSQPFISTSLCCPLPLMAASWCYCLPSEDTPERVLYLPEGRPYCVGLEFCTYPDTGEVQALGEWPCPPGPRLPVTWKRAGHCPLRARGSVPG